ncbi:hypothetical protein K523DRAFT_84905, partial [Schizophyllum commune Tattone D]
TPLRNSSTGSQRQHARAASSPYPAGRIAVHPSAA